MVVVLLAGSATARAQVVPASNTITSGQELKNADIAFVESNENSLVFSVRVDNNAGERFSLTIKGEAGAILYRGNFTDKSFNKKFVLPKGEDKLTFILKDPSGDLNQTFEINANTRVVEEVVVKRVI